MDDGKGEAVRIRPATAADVESLHLALRAMATHAGDPSKIESSQADLLASGFGETPAFEALIAEIDGLFAGMCVAFPSFSTWRGKKGLYIQDLFVDERFRGKQIGEKLLRAAASRGRAHGVTYLRLSVDVANVGAQRFYDRLGIAHARDEQIHLIKDEAFEIFAASGETDP